MTQPKVHQEGQKTMKIYAELLLVILSLLMIRCLKRSNPPLLLQTNHHLTTYYFYVFGTTNSLRLHNIIKHAC